jgi:thiamine-phosphate pyrophosphorylase
MILPDDRPTVCLITSGESTLANFSHTSVKLLDLISAAVLNQVSLIQIREKQLDGKQLFELVSQALSLTKGSMTKLVVNGRTDIALAAGADGVHLPTDAYSPMVARKMAGSDFLIGVSTHSFDEISAAEKGSADYVVFGPLFDTSGKSGMGVEYLKQAVQKFPDILVLGLGGIDDTNLCDVMETGAAGFAAIRYLNEKENLGRLEQVIDSWHK